MESTRAPATLSAGGRGVSVAICIVTHLRPRLLADLLESLLALRFESSRTPDIRVIVVDSDPAGSARAVVDAATPAFPWPVTYAVSSDRSISVARNTAVRIALGDSPDLVAFIDDDEVATPGWLDHLLAARDRYDADAVCGPVVPRYAAGVPEWVVRAGLLEPARYASGEELGFGMTGNALIVASAFPEGGAPFDPRFGRSGAEDTHFFMRLARSGGRVVWADDAIAEEHVPATRGEIGWMVRRAFRVGNCYVYCERDLAPDRRWIAPRVANAVARLLGSALLLLPSLALGRAGLVKVLRFGAHGAGTLAAFAGFRYQQYHVSPAEPPCD